MKIETLSPTEILPLERPHRPDIVESLRELFEEEGESAWRVLPFPIVHRVRGDGIYTVNGHHRIGVANLYGFRVPSIFVNTYKDLCDLHVLIDMGLMPGLEGNLPTREQVFNLSRELLKARAEFAIPYGVTSFDVFTQMIRDGDYALDYCSNLPLIL